MTYKEGCGFKKFMNVCTFKEEDCSPEKCDMYNINFDVKSLKKKLKEEQDFAIGMIADMKKIEKKLQNDDNKEFKEKKKQLKDLLTGIAILQESIRYLKRCGKR